jgi:hypothetical protein
MKLSELKKEIKDNIHEILSEESINEKRTIYKSGEYEELNSALNTITDGISIFDIPENDLTIIYKGLDKIQEYLDTQGTEEIDESEGGNITTKDPKKAEELAKKGLDVTVTEDEDREPTKAELEKEKVKTPSKFKTPNTTFEDFKTKLKTLVKKIKDMEKGEERDRKMAALKQFIKKPELIKAFKERDVKIDTDGLIGENKKDYKSIFKLIDLSNNSNNTQEKENSEEKLIKMGIYDKDGELITNDPKIDKYYEENWT